jgi:hypothetical protein
MTVYAVFEIYYIEEYYRVDRFQRLFSSEAAAQRYVDQQIREQKVERKLHDLRWKFSSNWKDENPFELTLEPKPVFDQNRRGDKAYQREHEQRKRTWHDQYEKPYKLAKEAWYEREADAEEEYMNTIDTNTLDVSDIADKQVSTYRIDPLEIED